MVCGMFEEHRERVENFLLNLVIKMRGGKYFVLNCNTIFPRKIRFDRILDESNLNSLAKIMTK